MKNLFKKQNNIIDRKIKEENNIKKISKSLALKINKKEDELLYNSSDGFRLKKELQSAFEENTEKNTKFGYTNDWVISLRENNSNNNTKLPMSIIGSNKNKTNKTEKFLGSPNTTKYNSTNNNFTGNTNNNNFTTTGNSFYPSMSTETRFMKINTSDFKKSCDFTTF